MRRSAGQAMFHTLALAAIAMIPALAPAQASRCLYPGVSATGPTRGNIMSAMNAAMGAWEQATAKRHGRRYAHWYYAGDGTVDCSWNKRGNVIRCRAKAVPCAD